MTKTRQPNPPKESSPIRNERLLTPIQVGEIIGVTVDSARKRMARGRIPGAVRLGREWRVKESILQAWIAVLPED